MKNRIFIALVGVGLAAGLAACTPKNSVSSTETDPHSTSLSQNNMENQPETYAVLASVAEIMPDAFHESYDDGFAVFDAVVLKVESPEDFPEESLTIFFPKGQLENLTWIKPGAQMKFNFQAELLKSSQLFSGALEDLEEVGE